MQTLDETTKRDLEAAALLHQVEPVISGPTTTKARKRGVGRIQKVLDAAPEPEEPKPPVLVRITHNGVVSDILGQMPKIKVNEFKPVYVERTVVETGDPETDVKVSFGPYFTDRRMRRATILPFLRGRVNKTAKASIAAKKVAMIERRRTTPMVTKAEREAALAV